MRRRILCFVFDGTGLGHLRRMSRIASVLQQDFSVLVVTGMREAAWIVPKGCEIVILPNLASVLAGQAQLLGRDRWLELSDESAIRMRRRLLRSIVTSFQPDAFIGDYLPFGRRGELYPTLEEATFKKYFVHRGVIDTSDRGMLAASGAEEIANYYDHIFIASDPRLVDVAQRDNWSPRVQNRASYMGFVVPETLPPASTTKREVVGRPRQLAVCSVGGGWQGEELALASIRLAATLPTWEFRVVLGAMSKLRARDAIAPRNCIVIEEDRELDYYHSVADIVVCHGGYNSIIESMVGGAQLIVYPSRKGADDEQAENAKLLAAYYPIILIGDTMSLEEAFQISMKRIKEEPKPGFPFSMCGAQRMRSHISTDLSVEE